MKTITLVRAVGLLAQLAVSAPHLSEVPRTYPYYGTEYDHVVHEPAPRPLRLPYPGNYYDTEYYDDDEYTVELPDDEACRCDIPEFGQVQLECPSCDLHCPPSDLQCPNCPTCDLNCPACPNLGEFTCPSLTCPECSDVSLTCPQCPAQGDFTSPIFQCPAITLPELTCPEMACPQCPTPGNLVCPTLSCPAVTLPALTCPEITCPQCPTQGNLICPTLSCPSITCPTTTCPEVTCPQCTSGDCDCNCSENPNINNGYGPFGWGLPENPHEFYPCTPHDTVQNPTFNYYFASWAVTQIPTPNNVLNTDLQVTSVNAYTGDSQLINIAQDVAVIDLEYLSVSWTPTTFDSTLGASILLVQWVSVCPNTAYYFTVRFAYNAAVSNIPKRGDCQLILKLGANVTPETIEWLDVSGSTWTLQTSNEYTTGNDTAIPLSIELTCRASASFASTNTLITGKIAAWLDDVALQLR